MRIINCSLLRHRHLSILLPVLLLVLASLACNLTNEAQQPSPAPPTATTVTNPGQPTIAVIWPPSGSEFLIREEITIHVDAADAVGITRVELRSPTAMLSSVPSPERNGQPSMEAILPWTPTRSGSQQLEVVAYRRGVASAPVPLTVHIRQRVSEIIATPLPFGTGDLGIIQPSSNAACQIRVDIDNLRYRSGPGTQYEILGILSLGETLQVTGINSTRTWYQVERSGQTAWVSSNRSYSTELITCANAPVVQ